VHHDLDRLFFARNNPRADQFRIAAPTVVHLIGNGKRRDHGGTNSADGGHPVEYIGPDVDR